MQATSASKIDRQHVKLFSNAVINFQMYTLDVYTLCHMYAH